MEEYGIYEKLTTKSHSMNIEAENYLPGGSSRAAAYFEPYPFFADRAEGHYIYDVDGNKFLDFMLNATTHILGHNNPLVADAVKKQIGKGLSYGVPAASQIKLSKMGYVDEDTKNKLYSDIKKQYDLQSDPRYGAARLWIDEIIDPRKTREVLIECLSITSLNKIVDPPKYGVLQV